MASTLGAGAGVGASSCAPSFWRGSRGVRAQAPGERRGRIGAAGKQGACVQRGGLLVAARRTVPASGKHARREAAAGAALRWSPAGCHVQFWAARARADGGVKDTGLWTRMPSCV